MGEITQTVYRLAQVLVGLGLNRAEYGSLAARDVRARILALAVVGGMSGVFGLLSLVLGAGFLLSLISAPYRPYALAIAAAFSLAAFCAAALWAWVRVGRSTPPFAASLAELRDDYEAVFGPVQESDDSGAGSGEAPGQRAA